MGCGGARQRVWVAVAVVAAVVGSLLAVGGPAAAQGESVGGGPDALPQFSACVGPALEDRGFADVEVGSVFRSAIDCLAHYRVTIGTGDGTMFAPEQSVLRWQMALFLRRAARVAGVGLGAGDVSVFGDLGGLSPEAVGAIGDLSAAGVMPGVSETEFEPHVPVLRRDMVVLVVRWLALADPELVQVDGEGRVFVGGEAPVGGFVDVEAESVLHRSSVAAAFELGVTRGSGEGLAFSPGREVSRGQMAAFVTRMLAHSNARPRGLTAQADGRRLVVSVRGEGFEPVPDAQVGVFWASADAEGSAVGADGECAPRAAALAQGQSYCSIGSSAPSTGADGNVDISGVGGRGEDIVVWAWTGDVGDTFDADEHDHYRVRIPATDSGEAAAHDSPGTQSVVGGGSGGAHTLNDATADAAEPEASEVRTGERSGRSGETSDDLPVSIRATCRPPLPDDESPLGVAPNPTMCIPHRCIHDRVFVFLNVRERVVAFLNTGNLNGNTRPAFAASTETVALPEHSAAGTTVGTPITATDAEGDGIEYSLYCGYGDWMKIDSTTGQLRTAADPILFDYESTVYPGDDGCGADVCPGDLNLWFYVVATDGKGGAGVILVDVNLTDVAESPTVPAMPTATASTPTSLTVQWPHVQQRPGVPAVTSYELQYRAGTSGTWKTDSVEAARPVISAGPVGNARQITGLVANTEYQVQVQSTNAEGVSGWSPTLTARTSSDPSTVPSTIVAYAANALSATKMTITAGNLHDRLTTYSGQGYRVTWTAPTNSPTAQAVQVSGDGNTWSSTPCTRYTINCQVSIGAAHTMFEMFVQNDRWLRVFSDHAGTANDSYSEKVALPWP